MHEHMQLGMRRRTLVVSQCADAREPPTHPPRAKNIVSRAGQGVPPAANANDEPSVRGEDVEVTLHAARIEQFAPRRQPTPQLNLPLDPQHTPMLTRRRARCPPSARSGAEIKLRHRIAERNRRPPLQRIAAQRIAAQRRISAADRPQQARFVSRSRRATACSQRSHRSGRCIYRDIERPERWECVGPKGTARARAIRCGGCAGIR